MSFGNWPPINGTGGGGAPVWLALISSDGTVAISTPDFIAASVHAGPGVYQLELGALGSQIPTLGQPLAVVTPIGGFANVRAYASQTIQANPFVFQVSFDPATDNAFLFGLVFGNPPVLFP